METQENKYTEATQDFVKHTQGFVKHMGQYHQHSTAGRFMGGVIILAVGVIWLLSQMGTVLFPHWMFTWPMMLLVVGLYVGVRHGFRGVWWLIMMLIGGIYLAQEFYPDLAVSDYISPIVIIAVGLAMILRPRRNKWDWRHHAEWKDKNLKWRMKYHMNYGQPGASSETSSADDYIDSVSVFGNIQKTIVSKNFKGGDVVNIFGGAEINLMQADIKGKVVLEAVQIFGGTKIIVPADWEIQTKMVSIFGGVEDKRNPAIIKQNPDKVLVIDGTSIFAGIDILSY